MDDVSEVPPKNPVAHLVWVERAASGVELLAVIIIVLAILLATLRALGRIVRHDAAPSTYTLYRHKVGRALLLGLEVLVAADIIRTVLLEPTAERVLVLGLLVCIRILLSWSLSLEIERRWPWQPAPEGERKSEASS